MRLTIITALIASASQVSAWPRYNPMVPNGANVNGGTNIGHLKASGVGGLSSFGTAFGAAGNTWTTALCQADSDGDGQTNGQELGDPCCEFVPGLNPTVRWTSGVSNPGDSSSTSDPSLWASISCSGGAATEASVSTVTSDSGTTTVTSDSSTTTETSESSTPSESSVSSVSSVSTEESGTSVSDEVSGSSGSSVPSDSDDASVSSVPGASSDSSGSSVSSSSNLRTASSASSTSSASSSSTDSSTEDSSADSEESYAVEAGEHHHSGSTSASGDDMVGSGEDEDEKTTTATPSPTSESTPAATNSAGHERALTVGVASIAIAAVALW